MKIVPQDILNKVNSQKTNHARKPSGQNFDVILQQEFDKSLSPVTATGSLPPLQAVTNTRFDIMPEIKRSHNIERVEQFLTVLENYQEGLNDPSTNLKDLHSITTRLERNISEMTPILDSLPDGDPLKDVLNRTVVTSTVEVIKFNRGDYL